MWWWNYLWEITSLKWYGFILCTHPVMNIPCFSTCLFTSLGHSTVCIPGCNCYTPKTPLRKPSIPHLDMGPAPPPPPFPCRTLQRTERIKLQCIFCSNVYAFFIHMLMKTGCKAGLTLVFLLDICTLPSIFFSGLDPTSWNPFVYTCENVRFKWQKVTCISRQTVHNVPVSHDICVSKSW